MFTKTQWGLLAVNAVSLLVFGAHYLRDLNYEFLAYAVIVVLIFGFLYGTLRYTRFPTYIFVGMTVWAILHMMGGSVQTSDGVFYAYEIYPFFDGGGDFFILKMDQLVHALFYAVVALMFLHYMRTMVGVRSHPFFIAFVCVLAATGFGVLNEIIEFTAVVMLPETGVGGYENTVLDLIFNLVGAVIAVVGYYIREQKIYGKES